MAESTPLGSGGPLIPVQPEAAGNLRVRGGVGGIRFQLEELMAGAAQLDAVANELSAVEIRVRRIWEDLCPYENDPRPSGTAALIAVGEGGQSVRAVREELQHISSQVRASHWEYEAAEVGSQIGLRLGLDGLLGVPAQLVDSGLTGVVNRGTSEALTGNLPLTLGLLMGLSTERLAISLAADLAAGRQISLIAPLIQGLAEGAFPMLKPRPVNVAEGVAEDVQVDTSPAGLLAMVETLEARGNGQIDVVRVDNGGSRAFIVVIPGTQPEKPPGGNNPFDEAGIAEGLGYGSRHITLAIRDALRQAGAETHDQVVAVGYSQGGVHAMNLGQDKAFLAEFDLKYVLTAGSPVGGITPEPGINTLHLEHRQDWVPGSDGTPGPDTRDRVTVSLTGRVLTLPDEEVGLGPGHKLSNYEAGARAVSSSDDPSLVASAAVLAGVLGAGGAGTATRFSLNREIKAPDREIKAPAAAKPAHSDPRPARQQDPRPGGGG
jgi:hypothetical protein